MSIAKAIEAGEARERDAAVKLAEAWAKKFDRLLTAGGNPTIDVNGARQLRRYFTAFAQELRAGMHVPDGPPAPAKPRPLGARQMEMLEMLTPSRAMVITTKRDQETFPALKARGLATCPLDGEGVEIDDWAVISAAGIAALEAAGKYPVRIGKARAGTNLQPATSGAR